MSPVLKLDRHDEAKETLFELKYLLSLTTRQRFEMMFKKSKEIATLLERNGHRKLFEIIKRTKDTEDFKMLRNIQKMKKDKGAKK